MNEWKHEIAGRVHDIQRYHLLKSRTLPSYMTEFKKLAKQSKQLRPSHSAVSEKR